MGISYGPADWPTRKIDIEKNRKAFRRGMCGMVSSSEGFFGKKKNTTSITDKYSLTTEEKNKYNEYIENIQENINTNITNSMNKLVTNVMVDVVTKTDNIMDVVATGSNVAALSNTKFEGENFILNLDQENEMKVEADMTAQTKVVNEIKQKVSDSLSEKITDEMKDGERLGEELGKVVNNAIDRATESLNNTVNQAAGVANNYVSTAGDTLQTAMKEGAGMFNNAVNQGAGVANTFLDNMNIGSSSRSLNQNTEKSISAKKETDTSLTNIQKDIQKNTNKVDLKNITESAMNNNLKTETLNECKGSASGMNEFLFEKNAVTVPGMIKLDISQKNKVKLVVKCVTNTEIVNNISTEIIRGIETEIAKMDLKEGTIEAAGAAVAGAIVSAGEATSTAAKGVGEGVSTGAQGVGQGINTAIGGQQFMIAIIAGILIFAYFQMQDDGMGGGGGY